MEMTKSPKKKHRPRVKPPKKGSLDPSSPLPTSRILKAFQSFHETVVQKTMEALRTTDPQIDFSKIDMSNLDGELMQLMKSVQLEGKQVSLPDFQSADADYRSMIRSMFGTQFVELRMGIAPSGATTDGSGNLVSVYTFQLNIVTGVSSLAVIFDEYQIESAEIHYVPHYKVPETSLGTSYLFKAAFGYVDYDNATAASGYAQACTHIDTLKEFNVCEHASWRVQLVGIPDKTWITTATTNVPVAYLKLYANGLTASREYGILWGHINVKFRAVQV